MWLLTSCSPIILAERRQRKSLGRICDVDASWHISVKSQICMFRPSCGYSATKVKLRCGNFPMQPGSFQHDLGWVLTFLLWRCEDESEGFRLSLGLFWGWLPCTIFLLQIFKGRTPCFATLFTATPYQQGKSQSLSGQFGWTSPGNKNRWAGNSLNKPKVVRF